MNLKFIGILAGIFLLSSCGKEPEEEAPPVVKEVAQDSLKTLEGEFMYMDNAAVLKGSSFIYGVELDSTARSLARKVEPLKQDEFDMVPVVVKAKILPNSRSEGWDEIAEIIEIIEIPELANDSLVPDTTKHIKNPVKQEMQ